MAIPNGRQPVNKKRNIILGQHRTSLVLEPYFWDCLYIILNHEKLHLNEFCHAVDRFRKRSSMTSSVRVVVLIYFRTLSSYKWQTAPPHAEPDDDALGKTYHVAAPAPPVPSVSLMPIVLKQFLTIESHAG